MVRFDENGKPHRIISYEKSKRMTAREIVSAFDFDHAVVPHAEGGGNDPWNLVPRLRADHREKTAKEDIPRIAKGKRLRASQAAFDEMSEAKAGRGEMPATKHRKGSLSGGKWKRKLDGSVVRRED